MTARLRLTLYFFIFLFSAIILRLFYWQVVRAEELSLMGKSQYDFLVKISPKRGEIKTSDGFSLVTNKYTYRLYADPLKIKDQKIAEDKLSTILNMDIASISAILNLSKRWVSVKGGLDNNIKEEIERLKIEGVGFEEESVRFYPEASLAAQLIGFVGKNDVGENKGYFGLEGYYDRQLRGKEGVALQVRDALGRPIISKLQVKNSAVDGRTLWLSIDRVVQFIIEKKLKEGIEKYQAVSGMVGVIEPKTGNILALSSFPSFDQREFQKYEDTLFKNPFISNLYEPGSTFKTLIMASAIDSGAVKANTKCDICDGSIQVGEYTINTWNNKYYPNSTMIDVIKHSDNTGMVFAARAMGLDKMLSYLKSFGIGEYTGIDLQGEVTNPLKPKESWYPIDFATASFGQGVSITPIELLTAFSAIANDGKRMEPHIVSKIETPDRQIINISPRVLNNPISKESAKIITEILVKAVSEGEAKWAKPKGYRIAGKTGTAQIPIAGHYDPNKTIASFIGFAPADDPKFAMLVIIDRPTTSIYGSETAAPLFFDIAKDILTYYKISPSE